MAILISLLLLATASFVSASKGQPKPIDLTVKALGANRTIIVGLSYNISGVVTNPEPCKNASITECLPLLQSAQNPAQSDSVIVKWSYNQTALPKVAENVTGIELRACYSPVAIKLRAWRQDRFVQNPANSKTCKYVITKKALLNASAGNGTTTWKLPNNVPVSSLNVRAYTVCGTDSNGKNVYCAYGQSPGYFAVDSWDSVPSWLIATCIPMMCVGPGIFVVYVVVKLVRRKRKQVV
jgi:hypothetical protein